ncbi:hypothetical protein Q4577_16215 [Marinovum sp. 2_MG-2023]|uniref:hypothetical protein n=1 Tax=Roseobacteraceae TaxID=2854170 RepID=UPI001FD041A7|nr:MULTISPECIES: hypothetical protein [Roseobacteraceae]MCJ7871977.1 hypothetical protein [Phaeobacter sp. J2-8]MDO6731580.1 hypothetical protein [Marinovum sp. 2_MG-2023]MDO6778294.1 hypothetical protein [Marinovum sp. 1_MG-2023]
MLALVQETVNETQTEELVIETTEIATGDHVDTMMCCSVDDGTDMFGGDQVQAMMCCS